MTARPSSHRTFRTIWANLEPPFKLELTTIFWKACNKWQRAAALDFLSKQYKTRRQTISQWSTDRLGQKLLQTTLPESLISDILRNYFFARLRDLMKDFLDSLGISHQECIVSDNANETAPRGRVRYAAQVVVRKYPLDTVQLYCDILIATDPHYWEPLEEMLAGVGSLQAVQALPFELASDVPGKSEDDLTTAVTGELLTPIALEDTESTEQAAADVEKDDKSTLQTLEEEFLQLKPRMEGLGTELRSLGALVECGTFVDATRMAQVLGTFAVDLNQFLVGLRQCVAEAGLQIPIASLAEAESALKELNEVDKRTRDEADKKARILAVLDDVIDLRHVDGIQFLPLLECQQRARVVQDELKTTTPLRPEMSEELEAFSGLVAMVMPDVGTASDEEKYFEKITTRFGPKIAYAVLRKKIEQPS